MKRFLFVLVLLATVALLAGCGGGGGGGGDPLDPPVNNHDDIIRGKVSNYPTGVTNLKVHLVYIDDWMNAKLVAYGNVRASDGAFALTIPQSAEVIGRHYFLRLYEGPMQVGRGDGSITFFGYQDCWYWYKDAFSEEIPISQVQWDIRYQLPEW